MLTINKFDPKNLPHTLEKPNPFSGIDISTEVCPDQVTVKITDTLLRQYTREMVNLRDNAVKNALISLGWKPPSEVQKLEFIFDQEHSSVSVKKHGEVIMKCKLWEFTVTHALNLLHTCGVEITKTCIDEENICK